MGEEFKASLLAGERFGERFSRSREQILSTQILEPRPENLAIRDKKYENPDPPSTKKCRYNQNVER
jgi:hypothetical protein